MKMSLKKAAGVAVASVGLVAVVSVPVGAADAAPVASPAPTYYYLHPSLNVSTTGWTPGSLVTAHGAGFLPNEQVLINFGPYKNVFRADGSGSLTEQLEVPGPSGVTRTLLFTGLTSSVKAEYAFPVQAFHPWGAPSSYYTPVGSTEHFSGWGFQRHEKVTVTVDGTNVAATTADDNGNFNAQGSYVVPSSLHYKTATVVEKGQSSGASTTFTFSAA